MKEAKRIAKLIRAAAKGESNADAASMRKLAKVVASGDGKLAYKTFKSLDTFVREGIPDEVVGYICAERAGGKKKQVAVRVVAKGAKKKGKEFKKGMGAGVLYSCVLEFPIDATDHEMAMVIMQKEEELLKEVVEVEFDDPVEVG